MQPAHHKEVASACSEFHGHAVSGLGRVYRFKKAASEASGFPETTRMALRCPGGRKQDVNWKQNGSVVEGRNTFALAGGR